MITVVMFSRNRALQTSAFIDSLMRYGNISAPSIHVIYTIDQGFNYDRLRRLHKDVNWHRETDLNAQFLEIIKDADDHILFGVEDVFFTDYFDTQTVIEVLDAMPKVFGFSLRLGVGIQGAPPFVATGLDDPLQKPVLVWDWTSATDTHWSYPWEISASVYRKADVVAMTERWRGEIFRPGLKPNALEWQPWLRLKADRAEGRIRQPFLACFERAKSLTLCVNKVSATSTTWVEAAPQSDLISLQAAFDAGIGLNWRAFHRARNPRIHVGASYFRLCTPDRD